MTNPPLRVIVARLAAVAIVSLAGPPPLHGQSRDDGSRRASFTAGASLGDGKSALALSAGLDFRLSSRVGAEVEIAYARNLDFRLDVCPAPLVCVRGGQIPVTGRTVSLIPQLAIQLLPPSRRLQAYLQAGVGAGHVRQRYFFGPPFSSSLAERTRSNVTIAFAFGGGAAMQISQRVALGADVRSLHLLDEAPPPERFIMPAGMLSALRVGSRVSWRF